jgi:hypothetical protein
MKFKDERPFASINAGVKKLLEIASAMEADPAGRLHIGPINQQFLEAGASVSEYSSALKATIDRGYLTQHPSGAFVTFTQAGADLFA